MTIFILIMLGANVLAIIRAGFRTNATRRATEKFWREYDGRRQRP